MYSSLNNTLDIPSSDNQASLQRATITISGSHYLIHINFCGTYYLRITLVYAYKFCGTYIL